ncbi:MAG: ORC complex protein Cdc6/Orc1 [uncultured archaeon A07HN63]|nr:MAG: ORC complex protein Cdc6/Orc1 [uncultured archaeon A07HN63]
MTEDHTETDGESTDDTAASAPAGSESSDPTTDTNAADTDDPENDTTDDSSTADDEPYSTNGDGDDDESQTGDDDGFQTGDDKEDELRTGDNDGLQTDVPINIPQTDQSTDSSRDRSTAAADLDMDNVLDADDEDSEGLFDDLLSGEPIFEKKEVLRPSYTPGELPHRNDQINQMATVLVSALRGDTPSNILIYGKTGTGKTASAKYVSNELESTSQKYDVPCEVEYINCEVTDTQYRVLAQLANKFIEKNQALIESRIEALETVRDELAGETDSTDGPADTPSDTSTTDSTDHIELTDAIDSAEADGSHVTTGDETVVSIPDAESDGEDAPEGTLPIANEAYDSVEAVEERIESLRADAEEMETVPMTGWPTDRVYNSFFDAVDYNERVAVIMLDEIDKLVEKSGDDTLYNLSRMNNELENSRISIMGISNDLKFTDFLDPRVKSSLGEEEIVFPPYDATQLGDILQHRAQTAFKPDSLTDDVIPLCSAFAAQEHGDARRALDLLRTAGELAERGQADDVEEEHVRKAQDKIELDRVVEVVRTLPTQSKIVLYSIILLEQNGVENINTGEVFNIYKNLCEEIDADVLTQRRVTDLISELDMLGIVNAVVVSKGRYGRTKEMSLSVPLEETEAVLLSDSRLGDIDDVQPFVQSRFDST